MLLGKSVQVMFVLDSELKAIAESMGVNILEI